MASARTIAVTGATGFIGRHVVRTLSQLENVHLVLLTRREGSCGAADEVRPFDLSLPLDEISRTLDGVETVVHLAAYLPKNYGDPIEASRCVELNALGTLNILRAAQQNGVEHFVHCSSGAVYRHGNHFPDETSCAFPVFRAPYYLGSKLLAEIYVAHAGESSGLKTSILRLASVYGPGMSGGAVHLFATKLIRGERVRLDHQGSYGTDLVYVEDVSHAVAACCDRRATGIFNISSGRRATMREVAELLADLAERPFDQCFELDGRCPDSPPGFPALNPHRAVCELDLRSTPLRDGLAALVKSLSTHHGPN